jgi:hypothetical protein
MERYFILVIAVTLAGVITQKKDAEEANFHGVQQRNSKIIAAVTPSGSSTDHSYPPVTLYKFKTSGEVLPGKKIQASISKESIQQMIKNWRRHANKMPGSTNPRILFNRLRTLPLDEPYFIQ